ncbi:hypothetical protein B0A54_05367 [Friedmanniomyces endolithicus]|uniref:Hpc2-related domain-containing protein n=1 Tax=Friedmanniomyces endolithicus TaxID=329885 RepID=A0A4U0V6Z2_9PEZI|nr:HIR complex subunit [Friedmanniomyces endolithicus]TKA43585.1 hypothetical protein B0A54_05367 [Friedmanniomyces endolithicus]
MAMPLGFAHGMQVDEAASDQSSSSSLSPPPPTTPQHSDTIKVAHPPFLNPHTLDLHEGVTKPNAATSALASKTAARAPNGIIPTTVNGTAPDNKPKRQRKKKEAGPDGKPIDDGVPKKTRKPREPKDKTAASTTGPPRAKKQKIEEKLPRDAPATTRQPMLTEMVGMFQHPIMQHTTPSISSPQQHRPSLGLPTSNPPTPRPISSGQNYDPVRGYDPVRAATMETMQQRPAHLMNGTSSAHTSPHVNRASASPSIASLIDPPMASTTSMPAPSHYPLHSMMQPAGNVQLSTQPPTPPKAAPAFPHPPRPHSPAVNSTLSMNDGAMDIDIVCEAPKNVPEIKAPSKTPSSGPTPKPARPTPPPAPKGTGSGLLSGSNPFGGPSTGESTERRGVNIDIHIPLNPAGGNTVNIAHEIAKKYGRDAINPRAAAHREELLRIAAAANKIEDISADDNMSVDLMSDLGGDDSNMEMGGVLDDEKSGTGADGKGPAVRRRRRKVEEYDKEDDFIDDTEMAWQEQAAVAKDGFFVYSGPLIPPGETANVESAAPAGRGSGRGRGSRCGGVGRGPRGGANGTNHASAVGEKSKDPNAPAPRGRARGGRGTGAPRKPRTTKAERERIEMEKVERERGAPQQPAPLSSGGGGGGVPGAMGVGTPASSSASMSLPRPMGYGGPPAQGTVA